MSILTDCYYGNATIKIEICKNGYMVTNVNGDRYVGLTISAVTACVTDLLTGNKNAKK